MEGCSYYEDPEKANCMISSPSDFAKSNLFYLQEIGQQHLLSTQVIRGEKKLSYLFFIVTEGKGKLEYDGVSYAISAGYCAFLDCRKTYCYYASKEELKLHYLYFNGSSMENVYREYLNQAGLPCFRVHSLRSYTSELEQIYKIAASASDIKEIKIYTKLISLLALSMNTGKKKAGPVHRVSHKQNLQNVKDYLDQNYCERICLDYLSEIFYINKFYLTRLFKEQFGISVNNYLIKLRIECAKKLLLTSDLSVEKIGFESGIGNANYFSKVFKRLEGMPPGEYRRKNRENLNG